jgi:putative FmdB family regulatory protein
MPTYEYRCKDCGHEFEAQQAFSDDPLTECPTCAGALKKKFGSVGIAFKGSGFYKNDSRGGSSSTSPATTSTDSSTTAPSTSTGSDTSSSGSSDSSSSSTSTSTTTPAKAPSTSTAPASA